MKNKIHPLRPDLYYSSILDVNFSSHTEQGRKYLLCDVDNTIARVGSDIIEPEILSHLQQARSAGSLDGICLVSNTVFGKKRHDRVMKMAETLNAEFVCAELFSQKPYSRAFREAMEKLSAPPSSCLMIGDQMFTDVLGAKRLGIFTILVSPLGADSWASNIFPKRYLEKYYLRHFGLL